MLLSLVIQPASQRLSLKWAYEPILNIEHNYTIVKIASETINKIPIKLFPLQLVLVIMSLHIIEKAVEHFYEIRSQSERKTLTKGKRSDRETKRSTILGAGKMS